MFNYTGRVGYSLAGFDDPLPAAPDLITGVGRMKYRKPDKVEAHHKKKRKAARSMAKRSRRRNR